MPVDYSKWKDIEISDDEDDTHPNIDTPSLFRWRHQARVERMEEKKHKKKLLDEEKAKVQEKMKSAQKILDDSEKCQDEAQRAELKKKATKQMSDLQKDFDKVALAAEEIEKKEKLEPWNVDTISAEGFDKSIINKDLKRSDEELSEDEKADAMKKFIKANAKEIKEYGMFSRFEDSLKYMQEHLHLVNEYSANYLVLWCIDLELEEKNKLMRHVAHQAVCLQFTLELAKQLDRDPRACVSAFFHRIQKATDEYTKLFDDELSAFISRIENRAKEKIKEAQEEAEAEEKAARLGPGGLDPLEVVDTLPEELKACFESQDIGQLKTAIANMDPSQAAYHMKRCVASGLWVPEGGSAVPQNPNTGLVNKEEEEEIYESVEDSVD